jgi:hypothetical protein
MGSYYDYKKNDYKDNKEYKQEEKEYDYKKDENNYGYGYNKKRRDCK